jgi:hypothetical protein
VVARFTPRGTVAAVAAIMKHSAIFSTLLLGTLTACPTMEDARFSKASARQLQRTFAASSGKDAQTLAGLGVLISGRNEPTKCPRIVTSGATTTASGPCMTTDGTWEGTLTTENVQGATPNPAYDPTKPSTVRLEGLAIVNSSGQRGSLDGAVTFDKNAHTLDSELTITDPDGVGTTASLHLTCDQNNLCTAGSSTVDVHDLGLAHIEGAWHVDAPFAGSITLRGSETLVFDIAGTTTARCVPFSIDSSPKGQVCPNTSPVAASSDRGTLEALLDVVR